MQNKYIWHTADEAPKYCFLCVFYDKSQGLSVGHYNPVKKQFCSGDRRFNHNEIKSYCDIHDLLALETDLEQSETCCTEWEKQALDYKAENIALSGELDCTRKALDRAKLILKNLLPDLNGYERLDVEKSINEITALEQKDVK